MHEEPSLNISPKVSVIIPVYNVERYLPECLDSVLAQTLSTIELICVDDCSSDSSPQILDEYAARDTRITVLHQEQNRGQGAARNAGLEIARGEYVYFLDSDDLIVPEALERVYERAVSDNLDGVFFDMQVIYESPQLADAFSSEVLLHGDYCREGVYTGYDLYQTFIQHHEWTCYVQRQLWRRQFLLDERIAFPESYQHEDECFALTAIVMARRVAFVREPLLVRRFREGSATTEPANARRIYGCLESIWKIAAFAREHDVPLHLIHTSFYILRTMLDAYYREFPDSSDIAAEAPNENLLDLYDFSFAMHDVAENPLILSEEILERCRSAKRLFLYGEGLLSFARMSCQALRKNGISVRGVFLFEAEGSQPAMLGCPVRAFDPAVAPSEGDFVLIAVPARYREEIEQVLDAAGWAHAYFKDREGYAE